MNELTITVNIGSHSLPTDDDKGYVNIYLRFKGYKTSFCRDEVDSWVIFIVHFVEEEFQLLIYSKDYVLKTSKLFTKCSTTKI